MELRSQNMAQMKFYKLAIVGAEPGYWYGLNLRCLIWRNDTGQPQRLAGQRIEVRVQEPFIRCHSPKCLAFHTGVTVGAGRHHICRHYREFWEILFRKVVIDTSGYRRAAHWTARQLHVADVCNPWRA